MTACYQVATTLDSEVAAGRLAATLVEERLAACVQVSGPLQSIYRWEGAVSTTTEWTCTAKTVETRLPALLARIRALHPYQQPEIVATAISTGDPGYLDWLRKESTPTPEHR
ncbi:MAG TPA: divalent-cation tolerance protein CutA [Gemmatimonadales bacterium]|nr:divalent-cation tolerance protein CutA [Gemmatimonadales bacterium]